MVQHRSTHVSTSLVFYPHGATVRIFLGYIFFSLHAHGILASVYFGKLHIVQHLYFGHHLYNILLFFLCPHGVPSRDSNT